MDTFLSIQTFLQTWVFAYVFPVTLMLGLFKLFYQSFNLKASLKVLRWFVIFIGVFAIAQVIINLMDTEFRALFIEKVTGKYGFAPILFVVFALLCTAICLSKLGKYFISILIMSFLLNLTYYMEKIVVISTSLHHDFDNGSMDNLILAFISSIAFITTIYSLIFIVVDLYRKRSTKELDAPSEIIS